MCGIIGYVGYREAVPILIQGLERLEYRGYDSAGIACVDPVYAHLAVYKEKGKIAALKSHLNSFQGQAKIGIGHTRWATHGAPSQANAHPHVGSKGRIALVHNGIIENYAELRNELKRKGVTFHSDTDTEVAVQLIEHHYKGDLKEAILAAIKRIRGFFAFVAIAKGEGGRICAVKRSNPLVIGIGQHEHLIASDVSPLLPYTKRVIYLGDNELVDLTKERFIITNVSTRREIRRQISTVNWDVESALKDGRPHYMLKEIEEQPRVVEQILKTFVKKGKIYFDSISPSLRRRFAGIEQIQFVSCGTAYHAGLIGNYMVGEHIKLAAEGTVSSEFRYEDPVVGKKDLVVLITQSGETADTLAALREAKEKGALTLAIVNVVGSTIAREADCVIYTHAGPEIGVASTKAYVAQLTVIALFVLYLAGFHKHTRMLPKKLKACLKEMEHLPDQIRTVLKQHSAIQKCAREFKSKSHFLYLGRGYNFPNALEGALKLKEISYAHAHGYPAGEMKHGPIALIDSAQPVICICPKTSKTYEKMLSNIQEVKARHGILICVGSEGDRVLCQQASHVFYVPLTSEFLSPILTVIPLQLFAYHVAVLKGRNVDQPRNLAKSVTVE